MGDDWGGEKSNCLTDPYRWRGVGIGIRAGNSGSVLSRGGS